MKSRKMKMAHSEITFDEPSHTYRLGGEIIPSVGFILKEAGLVKFSPYAEKYLPEAARRGKMVHECCEKIDLGEEWAIEDKYYGYVESYLRFLDIYQPEWFISETIVYNSLVAGRLDRAGKIVDPDRGVVEVISDLKTSSSLYPHYRIQLAGYSSLLDDSYPGLLNFPVRCIVKLDKNGKDPKLVYFENPHDLDIFKYSVLLYHFRLTENLTGG